MDDISAGSTNPWGLESLLDVKDVAEYLGVPVSTVYDWRARGIAPRGYRFGKHVKFAVADVREWMSRHRDSEEAPRPDPR